MFDFYKNYKVNEKISFDFCQRFDNRRNEKIIDTFFLSCKIKHTEKSNTTDYSNSIKFSPQCVPCRVCLWIEQFNKILNITFSSGLMPTTKPKIAPEPNWNWNCFS